MPGADHRPLRGAYGLRPAARQQLVRDVACVMACGPRVVAELLLEFDHADEVLRHLANYRRLAPEVAQALRAGDWTRPLRAITPKRLAVIEAAEASERYTAARFLRQWSNGGGDA